MAQKTFRMLLIYSILFCARIASSIGVDTITPVQFLRDGETIVSASESFELGFFSPGSSTNRYLGIWYKSISAGTVVWVANREAPLFDRSGVLKVTSQGTLVLQNSTKGIVWSSASLKTTQNPVAQLLETGNLVVKDGNNDNPEKYLWQSFDYPSDTFLPGMKIGRNKVTGHDWVISSWKSANDPARGDFSIYFDPKGCPQPVIKKGTTWQARGGPWNGLTWSGVPILRNNPVASYTVVISDTELFFMYRLKNISVVSRLLLQPSGLFQCFTWVDRTHTWMLFYTTPADQCDTYGFCGAYSKCNVNSALVCACLLGFVPKSLEDWRSLDWSGGCVRKVSLHCPTDGFLKIQELKLPDSSNSWVDRNLSLGECERLCAKNCSCTAFANSDVEEGGKGCLLWFNELIDIKDLTEGGQDLYIRMEASELARIQSKRNNEKKLIGIIAGCGVLVLLMLILGLMYKRNKKLKQKQQGLKRYLVNDHEEDNAHEEEDMELQIFHLASIRNATDNFSLSNKLGQGGFGPVYKGILINGTEIAVKRLSTTSSQGSREFKNEVISIANLQHRNLVKLLGCCIGGDEKMLIYEYMPNKSLDFFIFDESRSRLLDWPNRFRIILGISRGLLYLHHDSRLRIIHRDLKASNILLDTDMNPKISDFGLAKIFGRDQSVANTNRVVGTYGYMSPEYAVDGVCSVKSDVFSYGVLVLEIVSGKRNRGFCHEEHGLNLLGHAWRLWHEERSLELIDKLVYESWGISEVLRCIHVALLCVQKLPEYRPNMSTVVLMLGSEVPLPEPKQPGFYAERNPLEVESSSSKEDTCSRNTISTSLLEPR